VDRILSEWSQLLRNGYQYAGELLGIALGRLEGLTRTPEGASAFAEVSLFLARSGKDPASIRRALDVLAAVDGTETAKLHKALRLLDAGTPGR